MMIIPAIDLRGGKCVRLFKGDYNKQTTYSHDPVELAGRYSQNGFEYLHIVDLDGAQHGNQKNAECIRQITQTSTMPVQLGGGIRDTSSLQYWLQIGVARCVVGSIAVTNPNVVKGWLETIGGDKLVLALDIRINKAGAPMLSTHGWTRGTNVNLWDAVRDFSDLGLRNVLCTDISRDGAMTGPNLELYREFSKRFPDIDFQASGGIRDIGDLRKAAETGASAAITGRALLDGRISQQDLDTFLQNE